MRATPNVVAFSGGKDSTATAYVMAEAGEEFVLLFTPTGNELPEVRTFIDATATALGKELIIPKGPDLASLIDHFGSLPNNRQRWCTRMIKIQPCIAYLKTNEGSTLCVGLRADEMAREGLYGPYATYRYPLRERGMGLPDVLAYLDARGIKVPARTDCAVCYDQRLVDWRNLLRRQPEEYAKGEAWEEKTGHTFRSPSRDTWPAKLSELRAEFKSGRKVRGADDDTDTEACRVCRL
jgi:PP-loop superfamily ATP-utilizing enzyme